MDEHVTRAGSVWWRIAHRSRGVRYFPRTGFRRSIHLGIASTLYGVSIVAAFSIRARHDSHRHSAPCRRTCIPA